MCFFLYDRECLPLNFAELAKIGKVLHTAFDHVITSTRLRTRIFNNTKRSSIVFFNGRNSTAVAAKEEEEEEEKKKSGLDFKTERFGII